MGECNGCHLARLKKRYGDRLIRFPDGRDRHGWFSHYLKGEEPSPGQGEPMCLEDGTPIRFVAAYMSEGHSRDEDCSLSYRRGS